MVVVVAAGTVPLGPEEFNPLVLAPALKRPGPGFDAPDYVGSRHYGDLGVADDLITVGSGAAVVRDRRRLKYGLAKWGPYQSRAHVYYPRQVSPEAS